MSRGMSLFQKSIILISIPLALQVAFIGVMFARQQKLVESQNMVAHSKGVIAAAFEYLQYLSGARAATQIYGITGLAEHKNDIKERYDGARRMIERLEMLVADNPEQSKRMEALRLLLAEREAWSQSIVDTLVQNGPAAAIANLAQNHGSAMFYRTNDLVNTFIKTEEDLESKRVTKLTEETNTQRTLMIVFAALILLLMPVLIAVFYQNAGKRLSILRENTERVLERKPLHPPLQGSDEIVDLDRAFHGLNNQIRAAEAKEARFREELKLRAEQLAATNAELSFSSQENEQFVYTVSHDLRSPLVNLQGFSKELMLAVDDLRRALSEPDVPEVARVRVHTIVERDILESVKFIQNAVTRLANIIDALLRLSRAGRVEYRMAQTDMNPIVKRVITALDGTIRSRNARVNVKELPQTYTDAAAVEQIFGNLLGNAVNYLDSSRPGIIEIGVETDAAKCPDKAFNLYYIRDNGMGIDPAHLPKVFVAFQRLHPTVAQGEGIGLALVKRTVERLGGRIWVESTPGESTTFYVCLPKDKKVISGEVA